MHDCPRQLLSHLFLVEVVLEGEGGLPLRSSGVLDALRPSNLAPGSSDTALNTENLIIDVGKELIRGGTYGAAIQVGAERRDDAERRDEAKSRDGAESRDGA